MCSSRPWADSQQLLSLFFCSHSSDFFFLNQALHSFACLYPSCELNKIFLFPWQGLVENLMCECLTELWPMRCAKRSAKTVGCLERGPYIVSPFPTSEQVRNKVKDKYKSQSITLRTWGSARGLILHEQIPGFESQALLINKYCPLFLINTYLSCRIEL